MTTPAQLDPQALDEAARFLRDADGLLVAAGARAWGWTQGFRTSEATRGSGTRIQPSDANESSSRCCAAPGVLPPAWACLARAPGASTSARRLPDL